MKATFVEDYYKKCSLYFPHAQKVYQLFTQAVNVFENELCKYVMNAVHFPYK